MDTNDNLALEHLRAIRGTLPDQVERLDRIELRLSAIEQTLGSLYSLSGSDRESIHALTRRVERIERRLELNDQEASRECCGQCRSRACSASSHPKQRLYVAVAKPR